MSKPAIILFCLHHIGLTLTHISITYYSLLSEALHRSNYILQVKHVLFIIDCWLNVAIIVNIADTVQITYLIPVTITSSIIAIANLFEFDIFFVISISLRSSSQVQEMSVNLTAGDIWVKANNSHYRNTLMHLIVCNMSLTTTGINVNTFISTHELKQCLIKGSRLLSIKLCKIRGLN